LAPVRRHRIAICEIAVVRSSSTVAVARSSVAGHFESHLVGDEAVCAVALRLASDLEVVVAAMDGHRQAELAAATDRHSLAVHSHLRPPGLDPATERHGVAVDGAVVDATFTNGFGFGVATAVAVAVGVAVVFALVDFSATCLG
jgi:hypothetical protein